MFGRGAVLRRKGVWQAGRSLFWASSCHRLKQTALTRHATLLQAPLGLMALWLTTLQPPCNWQSSQSMRRRRRRRRCSTRSRQLRSRMGCLQWSRRCTRRLEGVDLLRSANVNRIMAVPQRSGGMSWRRLELNFCVLIEVLRCQGIPVAWHTCSPPLCGPQPVQYERDAHNQALQRAPVA